jgi:hypothetical protein
MPNPIIEGLPTQKTLVLVGLSIITFFVYPAHYVKRFSDRLNEVESYAPTISPGLVWAVLIAAYASLAFLFGYIAVEETHPIALISTIIDRVSNILFIVWAFKVRARLHALLNPGPDSPYWFHGFWTFFFNVFYINYKIAKLKNPESLAAQVAG